MLDIIAAQVHYYGVFNINERGENMSKAFKFTEMQVESIIDKLVPLIALKEDSEFFRGVLFCKAESCRSSAEFSVFVNDLLNKYKLN